MRPLIRPMPPARLLITAVFTRLGEVVRAAGAAGVDQADAAHVAVGDLVAGQVDRMIAGRQLAVDLLVRLAELQRVVAAVVLRQLLLDDVGLDGHAEVIRLAGEVGRDVIVDRRRS